MRGEGGPRQAGSHPARPPSPTHPPPLPGRVSREQFQAPRIPGPASTGEEAENFLTVLTCLELALSVPAGGKRAGLGVGLSVTVFCVSSPAHNTQNLPAPRARLRLPAHSSPHSIPRELSGVSSSPFPYSATASKPAALGACRGLMMASKEGGCPKPGSQILSQSHSPRDPGTGALCGQQGGAQPRWEGLAWLKSLPSGGRRLL